MSFLSITKLYNLLTLKMGKEAAENLTSYVEEKINEEFNNKQQVFATKEDLANSKTDIFKWMFVFWIGQICATFGFILLFLKK
jgi:hypothetical protein